MSTFHTATQNARKASFTHLISGNGEKASLASVVKGMKASSKTKINGWFFENHPDVGECLAYYPHRVVNGMQGYYILIKEPQP